ncbi:MAG: ferrous iron transport protein B [Pirellulaceae bacterium]
MSVSSTPKPVTVALIGNPNTGKSTLFNALSGVRQQTGNYPGVTVEKKIGRMDFEDRAFSLVDLPGTYSLAPRSPDEMIAVDVLLGRRGDMTQPDVVLCIVDASNLERNLYLVSQVLELGRPTVLALNMVDVASDKGLTLDIARLRKQLDVPIVEIQANRKRGLAELKQALAQAAAAPAHTPTSPFPEAFQAEVRSLAALERKQGEPVLPRYLIERLILDTGGYLEQAQLAGVNESILAEVKAARERLAEAGFPVPAVEAVSRYKWVGEVLDGVVTRPSQRRVTLSDKIDKVLTHKVLGSMVFVLVMIVLFQAVFLVAEPASALIDWMNGELTMLVEASVAEGALRSLLVNGVIGGVGGVLVFLPQIFTLFLFIAILEDCGYMSRAAYLMDKLMSRVGLSGKSFIPLLSSFACAIPGIMATRVIENPRDRLTTILVAPLMSCSARLPVYTLLIVAFIPQQTYFYGLLGLQGITLFAMYSIGIVTAVIVAFALKRTMLRGATPPFVMELPGYKVPGLRIVLHRMLERGWAFIRRAGTLIFAVTVVVWAAAYYPRNEAAVDPALFQRQAFLEEQLADLETHMAFPGHDADDHAEDRAALEEELSEVGNQIEGEYLEDSFLGRAGHFVEPVVRPLGWDWRIGCAAIASFPAREVIIATLGVIYKLGEEQDEESETLKETLRDAKWEGTNEPVFNIPVALSIMVFFALCAQCGATLAVIRRETNSWRWPIFTFAYMTALAYLGALVTYQVGMLLTTSA